MTKCLNCEEYIDYDEKGKLIDSDRPIFSCYYCDTKIKFYPDKKIWKEEKNKYE